MSVTRGRAALWTQININQIPIELKSQILLFLAALAA